MIPLRLKLHNFMCYRDNVPAISFGGIHVACLSGNNGNGKSAIFDALTWALWGKSRSEDDENLIHHGKNEMSVELEFLVQNQKYRVIRKVTRRKTAQSGSKILDFQIFHQDKGFVSISESTINDTQRKIINTLRMDYKTFINSAFLRQGFSNEFSLKTPSERKEILAKILGLDIFDKLEESAKEKLQNARLKMEGAKQNIEHFNKELENLEEVLKISVELNKKYNSINESKMTTENQLVQLREKKSHYNAIMERVRNIKLLLQSSETLLKDWQLRLQTAQKNIAIYREFLLRRFEIEDHFTQLKRLEEELAVYDKKLQDYIQIKEKIKLLEDEIGSERQELVIQLEKCKQLITQYDVAIKQIDVLEQRKSNIEEELRRLEADAYDNEKIRKQIDELSLDKANLTNLISNIKASIKENDDKLMLISDEMAKCPLCEKPLMQSESQRIKLQLNQKINESKLELSEVIKRLNNIDRQLSEANAIYKRNNDIIKEQREFLTSTLARINHELAVALKAKQEVNSLILNRHLLERKIEEQDYAVEQHQKLRMYSAELKELDYDFERHNYIKIEVQKYKKYEELKQKLSEYERLLENELRLESEASEEINKINCGISENKNYLNVLESEISLLSNELNEMAVVEQKYRDICNEELEIISQIAANNERIKKLEEIKLKRDIKLVELNHLQNEETIYKDLIEAFSKKGIQALIISRVFPEIEIEANRLLGKMTDNRMSLRLESQKQLKSKKGELSETFEIKISDELGTRDYEMFSGGEAFRIDLSLRIALSKLLVRRAGASLPLLIIDEGFGSQDNTHLEKLVEAIKTIENDFEKIFIITHLDDLKYYFPTIINVIKDDNGSSIQIN